MRKPRSLRRTLASSLALVAVTGVGAVVATPSSANATVCGQYTYNKIRYYSHCGTGKVQIRVFEFLDAIPEYMCVSPGVTYIGPAWRYLDASSTRRSC